ncbi:diguanylate cyclase (GGDEF)-like protein/PAS domain S-box-containing protein [Methylohalomonas lacus]|uniref:cyclic-guanylate-specific phosphodiesterase n=1 Tax=Methylohalomonas lacus TaxID=398773 RepID=A0AAE3L0G3_9GAMM|nr:EAL domain-containing protein [Methylohalomonas lacus]MCS3902454.1 diguanylate cyclase (GGDEF)-like protein/PAS domain S-box-containing protein [Methylohalomonas lacus]
MANGGPHQQHTNRNGEQQSLTTGQAPVDPCEPVASLSSGALPDDSLLNSLLQAVMGHLQDMVIITEASPMAPPGPLIVYVNEAVTERTGFARDELLGAPVSRLLGEASDPSTVERIWQAMHAGQPIDFEIVNYTRSGEPFWVASRFCPVADDSGVIRYWIAIKKDIQAQKQAERQAHDLAFYDALTHLPNRRYLQNRLGEIVSATGNVQSSALLFIDFDDFKRVNDTFGHTVGDDLLIEMAKRLMGAVRDSDQVARIGGDEFVVLLESLGQDQTTVVERAGRVANKIVDHCNEPYLISGIEIFLTPSIGMTIIEPTTGICPEQILKQADMAMYAAKATGKNAVRFFDPDMEQQISQRLRLESELRRALARDEFELYYQPQFHASGALFGYEALIRWQHPVRGYLGPSEFIEVAEENNLIVKMGEWALRRACEQASKWMRTYPREVIRVSVNISPRQFHSPNFVQSVAMALNNSGLSPWLLKLELTENLMLDHIEQIIQKMARLSDLGVILSLDDFGTGFSSLYHLKTLPITEIKIDRSFVRDLNSDPSDLEIVRSIIDLSHNLHKSVIAEGVETREQYQLLQAMGCDAYQGYYLGRPACADSLKIDRVQDISSSIY